MYFVRLHITSTCADNIYVTSFNCRLQSYETKQHRCFWNKHTNKFATKTAIHFSQVTCKTNIIRYIIDDTPMQTTFDITLDNFRNIFRFDLDR
jgi:hypothetical protein